MFADGLILRWSFLLCLVFAGSELFLAVLALTMQKPALDSYEGLVFLGIINKSQALAYFA